MKIKIDRELFHQMMRRLSRQERQERQPISTETAMCDLAHILAHAASVRSNAMIEIDI